MDEVNNCKVINGKSVSAQHRVLVLDLEFKCRKRAGDTEDQLGETEIR